ncbi:sporulation protein [Dysosmobacter sp.]|uniref:sporulation protein n=1 Tax=Dysosmobacter sp. TaxID=2591382 RepID=UPI002A8E73D2|nr:sporulation protein [Dysosmobacter sp.]MDY3281474.1 sporulation protein [Dysosmobacter sp.]
MRARWRLPVMLLAVTALFWLLLDAREVRQAVGEGLVLCTGSVIPALFPFLCVSSFLTVLGFGELAAGPLGGLMSLYGLGGPAASALLLGLVGGYPVGARTAAELAEQGILTEEEGERLLSFCNNASPAFVINVLGVGVFGSVRVGVWLWLIHLLSALLAGLLVGRPAPGTRRRPSAGERRLPVRAVRLTSALTGAVGSALTVMAGVCAFVVFCYVMALPLRRLPGLPGTVLTGLVELFSASVRLPPDGVGFVAAAGLAGWGSVSVHCQTLAVLGDSGLSAGLYLKGKAIQGLLSAVLAAALAGYVMG